MLPCVLAVSCEGHILEAGGEDVEAVLDFMDVVLLSGRG